MTRYEARRSRTLALRLVGIQTENFVDLEVRLFFDRPVECYIDCPELVSTRWPALRVLLLLEPEEISRARIRTNLPHFDLVLGYDVEWANGHFFAHGGSWVPRKAYGGSPKSRRCSLICGDKMVTEGHRLRRSLVGICDLFVSAESEMSGERLRGEPEDKVRALSEYQYHLVVESVRRKGYFTEKLIDCFLLKTVPIYWGAPDIGDFFDVRGMILLESKEQIEKALQEDDYDTRLSSIQRNFEQARKYVNLEERLQTTLNKLLEGGVAGVPREGDDVADVLDASHEHDQPLKS